MELNGFGFNWMKNINVWNTNGTHTQKSTEVQTFCQAEKLDNFKKNPLDVA